MITPPSRETNAHQDRISSGYGVHRVDFEVANDITEERNLVPSGDQSGANFEKRFMVCQSLITVTPSASIIQVSLPPRSEM